MANEDILKDKIESWDWDFDTKADLTMSYSKLNVFENCPARYDYYYNQSLRGIDESTLALQVGTLCHKVLEEKANMIMSGSGADYDKLNDLLQNGTKGSNVDDNDTILGAIDLKAKYGIEDWFAPDSEGNNYKDKLETFAEKVVYREVCDSTVPQEWTTIGVEERFDFVYKLEINGEIKRVHFMGFIDRIDRRMDENGEFEYRVVDYKTSKKAYDSKATATALQMIIYGFYIYLRFGVLPKEYLYSFVLLNERQTANTLGYLKRGIKKIDKLLTNIFDNANSNEWKEKASPLCYYCPFRVDSMINDPIVGNTCKRYCLWTPDNKTFAIFGDELGQNRNEDTKEKRKLFF